MAITSSTSASLTAHLSVPLIDFKCVWSQQVTVQNVQNWCQFYKSCLSEDRTQSWQIVLDWCKQSSEYMVQNICSYQPVGFKAFQCSWLKMEWSTVIQSFLLAYQHRCSCAIKNWCNWTNIRAQWFSFYSKMLHFMANLVHWLLCTLPFLSVKLNSRGYINEAENI